MQSPIGPLDDDEDYDNGVVMMAEQWWWQRWPLWRWWHWRQGWWGRRWLNWWPAASPDPPLSLFSLSLAHSSSFFVQNCTDPREILKLTCTVFSALYWTDPAEILRYQAVLLFWFCTALSLFTLSLTHSSSFSNSAKLNRTAIHRTYLQVQWMIESEK